MDIKQEIHQLVDICENDDILNETIELLKSRTQNGDWWNKLSPEQKAITDKSLQESGDGLTLSHEEVVNKLGSKFSR